MSLIGYNIHSILTYGRGYSASEQASMWSHLERLKPASLLFLDNLDWAREAKRRLPNCIVVWRGWRPDDGILYAKITPQQFLSSTIRDAAAGGIVIQVLNEPDGYGDLRRLAAWCAELMDAAAKEGIALVLPNFGVGHPDTGRMAELDEMWQAFKRNPLHYYGCHEYGTYRGMLYTDETHRRDVVPWRVGRFQFVANYCGAKFGYIPPMLVTEFGIDSSFYEDDDKNKRGWRDSGLTDVQYAQQLIAAVKTIYNKPYIRGLHIFSHGNTGRKGTAQDWITHDVSFLAGFRRELEADAAASQPPAPPPPEPPPVPPPDDEDTETSCLSAEDVQRLVDIRNQQLAAMNAEIALWLELKARLMRGAR